MADVSNEPTLVLVELSFERVTLALQRDGMPSRRVSVKVGSGRNWYESALFPNLGTDEGTTSGDDAIDKLIRIRAAEELIRLAAAVEAAIHAGRPRP